MFPNILSHEIFSEKGQLKKNQFGQRKFLEGMVKVKTTKKGARKKKLKTGIEMTGIVKNKGLEMKE